jgi:hypothetical protein
MARTVGRPPTGVWSGGARRTASTAFDRAAIAVTSLPAANDPQMKLKLYSLFKQASVGPNVNPKPGACDVVFVRFKGSVRPSHPTPPLPSLPPRK